MSERHRQYLQVLGIPLWERRRPLAMASVSPPVTQEAATVANESAPSVPSAPLVPLVPSASSPPDPALFPTSDERAARIAWLDWAELEAAVKQCTACGLHASRTQTVFGVGHRQPRWLIIGEAPGADEDRLGEPFVGRAGKLLDEMLLALGLSRETAYIANILKCRPPNNRDPQPEEARCCWPFLARQITLLQPRIILAVGRIAAQLLLQTEVPIGKLRGRVHRLTGPAIPVVVTYHPAYLLRSPREKRKAWDDLQLASRTLDTELANTATSVDVR